jgi:hypothetical protein
MPVPDSREPLITVNELLQRIDAAMAGMGSRNPNGLLFAQCKVAIINLASRVPDEEVRTRSGLIIP